MKSTRIAGLHHTPRPGSWLVYFISLLFTQLSFVVSLCQWLHLILSLPWNALMSPMVQRAPSHCPPIAGGAISLSVSFSFCITHHPVSLPPFPGESGDVNMISRVIAIFSHWPFCMCAHFMNSFQFRACYLTLCAGNREGHWKWGRLSREKWSKPVSQSLARGYGIAVLG